MSRANDERQREWLEADGLGGFASGTVAGVRTRRYHGWLLSAERDGLRFVLVNEVEGVGHVSEVASAEPPHDAGGCPFQAWSLGELLRIERLLEGPATGTARDTGRAVVAMAP